MRKYSLQIVLIFAILCLGICMQAQNPFIKDQFTADPTARVFDGKIYVYPSHDILAKEGHGRVGWFCMEDYHVFSSENLVDWTDHGMIVSQYKVPWVDTITFSMWAPDCAEKNGKYYFYFPAIIKDTAKYGRGFGIGVGIAEKPTGPFVIQPEPLKGARGIDPNIFIDKDGQAYIYWAMREIYVAKLKDNMLELASEPQAIANLPQKGLKEGPFMFERNGTYYLTYPHVENKIERLEYATSNSPMGPFKITGVIMDESPVGCWTNHQSIVNYRGQWYLFYHSNDLSPKFDKNRSIRIDSLFFNSDGSIQKVMPTFRGVGLTNALSQIQIDRYTEISDNGTSVSLIDTLNTFIGWKTIFSGKGSWLKYNSIDFGKKILKNVSVRYISSSDCTLELRLDNAKGHILTTIKIPASKTWNQLKVPVSKYIPGIHHLVVTSLSDTKIEVDWLSFE